ncbi:Hypothetical protein FKW44_017811, partial [Caligus rogercresseyi]
ASSHPVFANKAILDGGMASILLFKGLSVLSGGSLTRLSHIPNTKGNGKYFQ